MTKQWQQKGCILPMVTYPFQADSTNPAHCESPPTPPPSSRSHTADYHQVYCPINLLPRHAAKRVKLETHLAGEKGVLAWLWVWRADLEYSSSSLSCMRMAISRSPTTASWWLLAWMWKLGRCAGGRLPLLFCTADDGHHMLVSTCELTVLEG